MKYFVDVDGRSLELDVDELPDGSYRVRGPGGEHAVDYLETTPHEASVLIDGRSTTFWFSDGNESVSVSNGRDSFQVHAVDERTRLEESILGKNLAGRGGGEVRSIMPGIVTRVLVKEGDEVKAGTPLLCIEAMKMENEVKAEAPGVVKRILVAAGKTVSAGQPLVEIAPA